MPPLSSVVYCHWFKVYKKSYKLFKNVTVRSFLADSFINKRTPLCSIGYVSLKCTPQCFNKRSFLQAPLPPLPPFELKKVITPPQINTYPTPNHNMKPG